MTTMIAFCYASGQICFGTQCPGGALPIAKGEHKTLMDFIGAVSRHAYDGETLLVPGVPEAEDQRAGLDALVKFTAWISTRLPKGIETVNSKSRSRRGLA